MTAVPLTPFALVADVADQATLVIGYPPGFTQASFTGANASATGQVAINDNDIYFETEGDIVITYGASTITIFNDTSQTWPAGAGARVQLAFTSATSGSGGGGDTVTAATLVALMAEAAADATLGPQLGAEIDEALAARPTADQKTALVARGGLVYETGETPVEADLLSAGATAGTVDPVTGTPIPQPFVTKEVSILVFDDSADVVVADGAGDKFWRVPSTFDGMNLVAVAAHVQTAGTTGTTDVQIARTRAGSTVDMLSTKLTIDSGEVDTMTAAAAAVINAANDDVATGDRIRIATTAVSTTAPKGLLVEMQFRLP